MMQTGTQTPQAPAPNQGSMGSAAAEDVMGYGHGYSPEKPASSFDEAGFEDWSLERTDRFRGAWDQLTGRGGDRYKLWPERAAQDLWEAVTLPGDVAAGKVDPRSEEGIRRTTGLASTMIGGSAAGVTRRAGEAVFGAGLSRPVGAKGTLEPSKFGPTKLDSGGAMHRFSYKLPDGKVANIYVKEKGSNIEIDMISQFNPKGLSHPEDMNSFGYLEARNMLASLAEHFPNAKTLTAWRVRQNRPEGGAKSGQVEFDLKTGKVSSTAGMFQLRRLEAATDTALRRRQGVPDV